MKRLILLALAVLLLVFHQQIFQWCFVTYGTWTEKPAPPPPPKAERFIVAAVLPAAASLARTVAGGHADVVSPLPAGVDPTAWVPRSEDLSLFSGANLIVLGGADLERFAAIYPPPAGKTLRLADAAHAGDGAPDPYDFLVPALAAAQADALGDALSKRDPAHRADYANNAAGLRRELETLDARFKALPIKTVFSSNGRHAALARACGWQVVSFDLKPGAPPTAAQLERLREAAKTHPEAKIMLWDEPPFTEAELHMTRLALVNVVFDPLLRETDTAKPKDYLAVMAANLDRLRDAGK